MTDSREGESREVTGADDGRGAPAGSHVDPFRPDYVSGADPNQPDMDQIFGILGNKRRRYALKYLSTSSGTTTMSDLAEQVTAWECEKQPEQITSKERKRVYVSLYQCHLQKMADASAVSYDKDRGEIERGEQFEQFTHYLRDDE